MAGWFDEFGWLVKPIPEQCLEECHHSGSCDNDVKRWIEQLGFMEDFPVEKAREYLRGYMGDEVDDMSAETLAQYVLFLFAADYQDGGEYPLGLV